MSCFRCKRTGEKVCDPEDAEIRCIICGACEAEEMKVYIEQAICETETMEPIITDTGDIVLSQDQINTRCEELRGIFLKTNK